MTKTISVFLVFAAAVLSAATPQDVEIKSIIDGVPGRQGLTQPRYLSVYGSDAENMLSAAFEARAEYWRESAGVIRTLAGGDIRNVPCIDPMGGETNTSYVLFARRYRFVKFKPSDAVTVFGREYRVTNAFEHLVRVCEHNTKRKVVWVGATSNLSLYAACDTGGVSFAVWPLGIAIHNPDSYAEEAAHFFNDINPRMPFRKYAGTWTIPDYATVANWNEFLSAFRGLKVHAYQNGINLNNEGAFITYYDTVKDFLGEWGTAGNSPVALNSYILLLAYREAVTMEGSETDDAGFSRLRYLIRSHEIARMVL